MIRERVEDDTVGTDIRSRKQRRDFSRQLLQTPRTGGEKERTKRFLNQLSKSSQTQDICAQGAL